MASQSVAGRELLPGPKSGLLSNNQKTCKKSKRLYCEGVPGQIAAGRGNTGELLCHMAHSLGFYGDGVGLVTGEKRAGHNF